MTESGKEPVAEEQEKIVNQQPFLTSLRKQMEEQEAEADKLRMDETYEKEYKAYLLYKEAATFWGDRVELRARDLEQCFKRTAILYAKMSDCLRKGIIWRDEKLKEDEIELGEKVGVLKAAIIRKKGTLEGLMFLRDLALEYGKEVAETAAQEGVMVADMVFYFQWLFDIFIWPDEEDRHWEEYHALPLNESELTLYTEFKKKMVGRQFSPCGWVEMYGKEYLFTSPPKPKMGELDLDDDWEYNSECDGLNILAGGKVILWEVSASDKPEYILKLRSLNYNQRTAEIYSLYEEMAKEENVLLQKDIHSVQLLNFRKIKISTDKKQTSERDRKLAKLRDIFLDIILFDFKENERYWYY